MNFDNHLQQQTQCESDASQIEVNQASSLQQFHEIPYLIFCSDIFFLQAMQEHYLDWLQQRLNKQQLKLNKPSPPIQVLCKFIDSISLTLTETIKTYQLQQISPKQSTSRIMLKSIQMLKQSNDNLDFETPAKQKFYLAKKIVKLQLQSLFQEIPEAQDNNLQSLEKTSSILIYLLLDDIMVESNPQNFIFMINQLKDQYCQLSAPNEVSLEEKKNLLLQKVQNKHQWQPNYLLKNFSVILQKDYRKSKDILKCLKSVQREFNDQCQKFLSYPRYIKKITAQIKRSIIEQKKIQPKQVVIGQSEDNNSKDEQYILKLKASLKQHTKKNGIKQFFRQIFRNIYELIFEVYGKEHGIWMILELNKEESQKKQVKAQHSKICIWDEKSKEFDPSLYKF